MEIHRQSLESLKHCLNPRYLTLEDKIFGDQLRFFRLQTLDLKTGKPLTQQRLGELLQEEIGIRYSGAAISDWERGKSEINANDRPLLTSLIKILNHHEGIKTLSDANTLLEAGNYRALNTAEKSKLFPEEAGIGNQQILSKEHLQNFGSIFSSIFFNTSMEFPKKLAEAKIGPLPIWPRVVVATINTVASQLTIFHVIRFLVWLWIWLITYLMISPSLQWPFASQEKAFQVMRLYMAGTITLPIFIGAMTGIKNNVFWQEQKNITQWTLRLFIYQGASIGFHIGYFLIFAFSLAQYYFQTKPAIWIEAAKMILPLFIGYTSAHLIPHNLWRAYGRLQLKDGGIFFIFIILGPLWAWFFLEFYETLITQKLGALLVLLSATLLVGAMAIQYQRKRNTIIPVLWIIIFYGLIFICQIASLLFQ